MKVACKQAGLSFPQIGIIFEKANIPYDVTEEQAKALLTNSSIYEYGGANKVEKTKKLPKKKEEIKIRKEGSSFADIDYIAEVDK